MTDNELIAMAVKAFETYAIGLTNKETSRLIALARKGATHTDGYGCKIEMVDTITRLKSDLASALEALKPFAVFVETNAGRLAKDGMQITAVSSIAHRQLTFGDCRRAAAELAKHKEKG